MTGSPVVFDYAARMDRARTLMAGTGLDVLLASVGSDLPYLTGYEAMPLERLTMGVIPSEGEATLVVPALEAPRITPQPGVFNVHPWTEAEDPVAIVAEHAGGARRAAITDQTWSVFLLDLQRAMPDASFVSARPLTHALRILKEEGEIELLRRAAHAVDRVAARLRGVPFSGRTERELSDLVAAMTVEEGSDEATFKIVASGPNGASPHHEAGDRIMAPGDAVVIDFGGRIAGYCSDTTRMFHVGEPDAEFREVFEVVRSAQHTGVEAAQAGRPAEEVDAASRRVIDDAGYGDDFIHRLGHGIGLDAHEDPYLIEGNAEVLQPGMAFSIEPGVYLPGRFGVRIEDIVVCTEDGPDRLNVSDRALAVVE